MAETILDLTTKKPTDRRKVRIDGELYEIRSIDELQLGEMLEFASKGAVFGKLGKDPLEVLASLKDNQISDLTEVISKLTDKCLIAPDEIKTKLTEIQKLRLIQAVFSEPGQTVPAYTNSSPDFSGSTEEIPQDG